MLYRKINNEENIVQEIKKIKDHFYFKQEISLNYIRFYIKTKTCLTGKQEKDTV